MNFVKYIADENYYMFNTGVAGGFLMKDGYYEDNIPHYIKQ